jgi:hypothetical protein
MSEYQYYEFCRIKKPLSPEARKEMTSLSSRTQISTHGVSYTYNYGDFRGDIKQLLLKYFDIFFYISNWGTVRLIFKYDAKNIDLKEIKKYLVKHVIDCEQHGQNILLDIDISNEEGGGWTEGEGVLLDLLPLYTEIENKSYQFLQLVFAINDEFTGENTNALNEVVAKIKVLSPAQKAFLESIGVDCIEAEIEK